VPKPDLVAWPETMIGGPINPEILKIDETKLDDKTFVHRLKQYDADLKELANSTGAYQLVGAPGQTFDWLGRPTLRQNLTILYAPGTGQTSPVYAKRHLVPFGEYIPFRNFPYVGPYMVNISPYRDENNKPIDYSDAPGDQWTRFHLAVQAASEVAGSQPGHPELIITRTRIYTFATPICFEDTMPEPARMMTAPQFGDGRKTDFLINVSNDGWFLPAELDQRMQASQLRAVENRVPIARAVNTGNSGFVDSRGRIVKLVTGPNGESIGAVGTASLVMPLDSRITLFSQIGDLLPIISGIAAVLGIAWTFIRPRREGKTKPE
jgi:apolipoprotein N-acyltransferase